MGQEGPSTPALMLCSAHAILVRCGDSVRLTFKESNLVPRVRMAPYWWMPNVSSSSGSVESVLGESGC